MSLSNFLLELSEFEGGGGNNFLKLIKILCTLVVWFEIIKPILRLINNCCFCNSKRNLFWVKRTWFLFLQMQKSMHEDSFTSCWQNVQSSKNLWELNYCWLKRTENSNKTFIYNRNIFREVVIQILWLQNFLYRWIY